MSCAKLLAKKNSVDLIRPHAWIGTLNKENLVKKTKHKSDGMKEISLGFSESELFENPPKGLGLRGHELPLTSRQEYKKTEDMLYNSVNEAHPERLEEIGQKL